MLRIFLATIFFAVVFSACSEDESTDATNDDNFDRKAMLVNYADNIIIPFYNNFEVSMRSLSGAVDQFIETSDLTTLAKLQEEYKNTYHSWQQVAMFQIGKAEEIAFLNFMNSYPVNVDNLVKNIENGQYDLSAISQQDEQGFPALDYLVFGVGINNEEIIDFYINNTSAIAYKEYLKDVIGRMSDMTGLVVSDWNNSFRDTFVNNSGSSKTSSFNKLVNDYIFYYEKHLRAGKVGIPAGVFSKDPLSDKVEAYYAADISKSLFTENLKMLRDFFNGEGTSTANGIGMSAYLKFLNIAKEEEELDDLVNGQFETIENVAESLNENFTTQIKNDNTSMLSLYDELQKNVILLKVDVLQALSISVDYVDADGD